MIERSKDLDERYEVLSNKEKSVEQAKEDVRKIKEQLSTKLEEVAKLTKEEAEKRLIQQVEEGLKEFIAKKIKEAEFKIQSESDDKARDMLIDAMQRSATDYVAETTSTTIEIEKEEQKVKLLVKMVEIFDRLNA